MSTNMRGSRELRPHRIAALTPDSPDPEARADANNPALMALLEESRRRARQPGGSISSEELERRRPLSDEERAAGETLLAEVEAADRAAGVIEPRRRQAPAKRPSGRRPDPSGNLSGRLVVRFPKSMHRELARRATEEGVSLNQLILSYVSRCLGAPPADARS
jgi:HicB family